MKQKEGIAMLKKVILLFLFAFAVSFICLGQSYATTVITLEPTDDAPTYSAYPNANFDTGTSNDGLWTGKFYGTADTRSYIKFDLSAIPVNLETATLYLYNSRSSWPEAPGLSTFAPAVVNTYLTSNAWTESTITWNNQPALGTVSGSTTVNNPVGWYSWDVSNIAQTAQGGFFSIAMISEGAGKVFYGKDNICPGPYLDVTMTPEPVSSILFVTGGATLALRRYWKRKRN